MQLLRRVRADTRGVESRGAQRRQIAGAKGRVRHDDARDGTAGIDAQALIVAEEEQLVAHQRSADRAAELVLVERVLRLGAVLEIIARIQMFVPLVEISGSVKRVRAALGDRDQHAAARFPVFRGHAVGFDPELLNRIDRRVERLPAEHRRRHRGAVEDVILIARAVAVDPQVAVVAAAVARLLLRDAGGERDQIEQVSRRRQLLDLLLRHRLAETGPLGLQQRRNGGDVDRLARRTQRQRHVDFLVRVDLERDR